MTIQFPAVRATALRHVFRFRSIEERIGLAAFALLLVFVSAQAAFAHEYKAGSIEIEHPWSRATPPGAAVAGGYLILKNEGGEADRLISATFEGSDRTEIHEMSVVDGVMRMSPLPEGLAIPARESVKLAPGGYHLMFMGLKAPLAKGSKIAGTLTFEKGGTVAVEFDVEAIGAAAPAGAAGHGDMHKMEGQ